MNPTPDLFTLVRRADPDTSRQAAEKIAPKLTEIQAQVFEAIEDAEPFGLTDHELEERMGDHGSTWRSRRAELVEAGRVKDSGERRLIEGSKRIVWRVA